MALTIAQRVEKGKLKLIGKSEQMKTNYEGSITRAIDNYRKVGFNAQVTADYEAGLRRGAANYRVDPVKWAENYSAKMV